RRARGRPAVRPASVRRRHPGLSGRAEGRRLWARLRLVVLGRAGLRRRWGGTRRDPGARGRELLLRGAGPQPAADHHRLGGARRERSLTVMTSMHTHRVLDEDGVNAILDTAERYALKRGHRVVIAVVERSGELIGLRRTPGAQVASSRVAVDKARTAAIFIR